jgi:hypothetical protein
VPPYSRISGPPVIRLPSGSILTLDCQVSGLIMPPTSFYWTHNEVVITPKNRPGLSLESEKLSGMSLSKLVVVNLTPDDAGTYACVTDVTRPEEVELYIGKKEEAHT